MTEIALIMGLIAAVVIPAFLLRRRKPNDVQVTRLGKNSFDVSTAYEFAPMSPGALDEIYSNREQVLHWLDETRNRMKGLLYWHLKKARRNFRFSTAGQLRLLTLYLRFVTVGAYVRLNASLNPVWSDNSLACSTRLLIGLVDAIWTRYTVLLINMARLEDSSTNQSDFR